MRTSHHFIVLLTLALRATAAAASALPSPESAIVEQPTDVLVTEGDEAVLKCKTSGEATRCKWLLNRTENPYELVDVKEFYPKRDGDCSIRIKQVREAHVGRWVCSVFVSLLHERLVSRPARVAIATLAPHARHPAIVAHPGNASALPGQSVSLPCRMDAEDVTACGWAMPDDVVFTLSRDTMSLLETVPISFDGDLARGDCSIRLEAMEARYAGTWSCFFRRRGETIWTGPGHLEMADAGPSAGALSSASASPAVIAVLALALVAVASALVGAVIYRRRVKARQDTKLLENPLYGIKNLQLAASAAQRKAKEAGTLGPVHTARGIDELSGTLHAQPNDYTTKGFSAKKPGLGLPAALSKEKEPKYAHVYDTPRRGHVYDSPRSSQECYQVPRSSYEIPPPPVSVQSTVSPVAAGDENVYEEVKLSAHRGGEQTHSYLIPQKLKM